MAALQTPLSARSSAQLRLFGTAEGDPGAAPWFKPERLTASDFSAEAYVADLRRFVPLESLSQELEAYLGTLRGKLVEVINEDYNDFVSLSTKLVNVDGAVLRMQRPLQEVAERLGAVRAGLQGELNALGEGLRKRQETAAARTLLELMQDTAHTMSKVENLLAEIEAAEEEESAMSGEPLDSRCRMLERLASEVSRLNFYAAKGAELPFVQHLEPRMAASKEKLQFRLSAALKAALVDKHASARQHCLLAYASISDAAGAEQAVRDAIVRPLVAKVLEQHPSAGPRPADIFPQVLTGILDRVGPELGPLLEVTLGSESGLQSFNFLGGSLLAEVDHVVAENLPAAISPGVPATFLSNYQAAMAFLDGLETYCASRAALTALRRSPFYASFLRRWKLSIYFSTRFQEIAGALEAAISGGEELLAAKKTGDGPQLQLNPSQALVACLQRAVSPATFLRPLSDKFARLVLQLLARYCSWLRLGVGSKEEGPAAEPAGDQVAPDGWGRNTPVELLASARADVGALFAWLDSDFAPRLQNLLSFLPSEASEGVGQAFSEAAGSLRTEGGPLSGSIVVALADRCSAGLAQLRGITAMYRMSARPSPTRPSHYVGGILSALKQFLDLPNARAMQPAARTEVAEGVISEVAQRFSKMATELLDTLRKTESSLKRIRQSRATDASAGGGPSDIDKISLQLFLDVQEFGRQAAKLGVDVKALEAFRGLWSAVAPADKAEISLE